VNAADAVAYSRRQKERRATSALAALIASPATAEFTMPCSGMFRLRTVDAIVGDPVLGVTLTGPTTRTISCPAGSAGSGVSVYVERGTVVTPEAGFELYADVGMGHFRKIYGEA
jgi:hypothetical protein